MGNRTMQSDNFRGRHATKIPEKIYRQIEQKIIDKLTNSTGHLITLNELIDHLRKEFGNPFEVLGWYVLQVKIDMEDRNIIRTSFSKKKQMIELVRKNIHSHFSDRC